MNREDRVKVRRKRERERERGDRKKLGIERDGKFEAGVGRGGEADRGRRGLTEGRRP